MTDTAHGLVRLNEQPGGTQFLEFSGAIALETCRYLESATITRQGLQAIPRELLMDIARRNAHDILQLVAPEVMRSKEQLTKYFSVVFGLKLNFTKFRFPIQEGFPAYMVVPTELNEDHIMEAFAKRWGLNKNQFRPKQPLTSLLDRSKEQSRPRGTYVLAHSGKDEIEGVFAGASYDDATRIGINFASIKEYLLMTGFHKFKRDCFMYGIGDYLGDFPDEDGQFMDQNGWTRTSSFYKDGSLVLGRGGENDPRNRLSTGDRAHNSSGDGPRQIILMAA